MRSVSSLVQPTSPIYLSSKELCLVAEMTLTHSSHSSNVLGIVLLGPAVLNHADQDEMSPSGAPKAGVL